MNIQVDNPMNVLTQGLLLCMLACHLRLQFSLLYRCC
jgi:hypothetical protein